MSDARFPLRAAMRQVLAAATSSVAKPMALRALTACVALSPVAAIAQTPPAEQTMRTIKAVDDSEEPQPVVTQVGKTPQLLRDVPQTITVLNREVLDAQGATTLTDALRNVPGITLSAGEGGNIGDNVNLRGFSARTDIYLDGLRDRGQYSRDIAFLESVEVLKGPSSMLFGRGSTGGVINQVSKQPNRRESITASASIGTDNYYRVTGDANLPVSDSVAVRIAAFGHSADSTRDIVETERYGVAPSLRWDIGAATQVTLSAVVQHSDDIPDYGFPFTPGGTKANPAKPFDLPRENFLGFTDDRFEQDVTVLAARISHDFSPNITLRNQTQFNTVDVFARPTTINGTTRLRNPRQREVEDSSLFNQTDLIVKVGGETFAHTITAGAEVGRDTHENQTYTTAVPLGTTPNPLVIDDMSNPIYGPTPAIAFVTPLNYTDNVGDTLAVYANEQLDIGAHWKIIGGLRWDQFDFDSDSTPSTGDNAGITTPISKTDTMTSVRAGVVYQPDEIQTYYVSYGTSFNPSAEGLTLSAANENVDPEENTSYEIGGKLSFNGGQLLITGALFRVEKDNARTTDSLLGTVTLDGDIRVEGVEFGISGDITNAWTMIAGYTYMDSEILKSRVTGEVGNDYPNTPEHSASFWTTYDFPVGLQVGGGVVYESDRLLNNANTAMTDAYTRLDATVAYIQTRYSIRLNLQNLTDELYFETASAGRGTPSPSRSAIATFNWTF
jgi:catecholate siderophore receptor